MTLIRRIFTDFFFIRAHPRHPFNPCSITILLLTDEQCKELLYINWIIS